MRLSTKVRGRERTVEQMNKTAVHEWEHMTQVERHDRKVMQGHIIIFVLTIITELVANHLGGMFGVVMQARYVA